MRTDSHPVRVRSILVPMKSRVIGLSLFLAITSTVFADDRVAHEFVPKLSDSEVDAMLATVPRAAQNMALSLPDDNATAEHAAHSNLADDSSFASRRASTFAPDRATKYEGNGDYYEVFSPAITPYKRVSAFDAISLSSDGKTPVLSVSDHARRRVAVVGRDAALPDSRPRDLFWGDVSLDFQAGREAPLPSVSPESRILSVVTEPRVAIHIEKDAADNFFAVLDSANVESVHMTFLTDAPRDYFGGPLRDTRAQLSSMAQLRKPMPLALFESANAFGRSIGITHDTSYRDAVDMLVGYFRSFEESETPPADTGDIYLDLARGKKGVCRHRAYAFAITAIGLGIQARFVNNEAHAWVEVMRPEGGWLRVDLGGAAHGLRPHATNRESQYNGAPPDAMPEPASYRAARAQAASNMENAHGASHQANGATWHETTAAANAAAPQQNADVPRTAVQLTVDTDRFDVVRGREIFISGAATDAAGQGVSGLRVEAALVTKTGDRYLPLGVTLTREGGEFHASFGMPQDVPVGSYRLHIATPGDRTHLPFVVE